MDRQTDRLIDRQTITYPQPYKVNIEENYAVTGPGFGQGSPGIFSMILPS